MDILRRRPVVATAFVGAVALAASAIGLYGDILAQHEGLLPHARVEGVNQPSNVRKAAAERQQQQRWNDVAAAEDEDSTTTTHHRNLAASGGGGGKKTPGGNKEPFKLVWPELKARVCPKMIPNMDLVYTMFELAREQLPPETTRAPPDVSRDVVYRDFYRYSPGGSLYTSPAGEKTLYLSIWKSGNDQIRFGSRELLGNGPGKYIDDVGGRLPFHYKNSCTVTAVRDPVQHFLSGYNELEERCPIDRRQRLPYLREGLGTKARFEQFVEDLVRGPSKRGIGLDSCVTGPYRHVYAQSGVLHRLSLRNEKLTAYLPSLKNLLEEWPKFVDRTCPGLPPKYGKSKLAEIQIHRSQLDPNHTHQSAKDVWAEGGPSAKALCAISLMDYACFDKLPDGVPELCQEVFSERSFVEAIRGTRGKITESS